MIPARRRSLQLLLGVLLIIWGSTAFTLPVGAMANSRGRSDSTKEAVQLTFGPVGEQGPAVSPDGRLLAFEYFHPDRAKNPEIWVMPTDGEFSSARALVANANRNADPTWSPDGKWISFMCEGEAKDYVVPTNVCKVNAETGEVVQLTHFAPGDGVSGDIVDWLADGRIAFRYNDCIYVIPSEGGPMTELLNTAKFNVGDFYDVRVSPSGERIAFMYGLGGENNLRIGVVDLKTGKLRHPLRGVLARFPAWINNDCLLYSRGRKPSGFTQTWVLCLSTGRTEELTEGPLDIEPTFNARVGAIFFAHSADGSAFLETHIWRRPMPRRLIESWFYRRAHGVDKF